MFEARGIAEVLKVLNHRQIFGLSSKKQQEVSLNAAIEYNTYLITLFCESKCPAQLQIRLFTTWTILDSTMRSIFQRYDFSISETNFHLNQENHFDILPGMLFLTSSFIIP